MPTDKKTLVERCAPWMRMTMNLRDAAGDPPVPGERCDLHGIGHARSAFWARFLGLVLAFASAVAFMIGSRPAMAREGGRDHAALGNSVGAALGVLSLAGFVAGGAIERRTRYHVWLRCEARTITDADVTGLVTAAEGTRARLDRAWSPDQLWIVGTAAEPPTLSLARAHGVRCFAAKGRTIREL